MYTVWVLISIAAILLGAAIFQASEGNGALTLNEALDAVAQHEGFVNWGALVKSASQYGNTKYIDTCYETAWYLYTQNN